MPRPPRGQRGAQQEPSSFLLRVCCHKDLEVQEAGHDASPLQMDSRKSQVAFGQRWGGVQTCYRVQRSVEKDMAQDSEKLGKKIVCEEKGKKYSQGQTKEFVDTKETA